MLFTALKSVAMWGFALWGIYKGWWVLCKIGRAAKKKIQERKAEQAYVNMLAGEIIAAREENQGDIVWH